MSPIDRTSGGVARRLSFLDRYFPDDPSQLGPGADLRRLG